jgi:hypothetical protein
MLTLIAKVLTLKACDWGIPVVMAYSAGATRRTSCGGMKILE